MSTAKKVPIRRCVGCGASKPKKELVRVVKTPEGEILLDTTGKKSGRGAYICPDAACLETAIKRKALSRALEAPIPPEVYEALRSQLAGEEPDGG